MIKVLKNFDLRGNGLIGCSDLQHAFVSLGYKMSDFVNLANLIQVIDPSQTAKKPGMIEYR